MKATKFHHDYPYRLRIQHPEYAEIRLERKGRFLRIDPVEPPAEDEVVVLTSSAPHRARGTVEALKEGRKLTVVASAAVLEWLRGLGTIDGHTFPATVDGLTIDGIPYAAAPTARPLSHMFRASVAGARAGTTLKRLSEQVRFPTTEPHAVEVLLEDGGRMVHLDLALHRGTDPDWLGRAAARFTGAEWLLVGIPWGEGEGVVQHVGRFGAKRVLLTELSNAERRESGLPTELVTPWRDQLVATGAEAHVFATQASYRFE